MTQPAPFGQSTQKQATVARSAAAARRRAAMIGVLLGFSTCVVGFGVMVTLWFTQTRRPGLLGFTHYRAATIGDAVLIPILFGSLYVTHYAIKSKTRVSTPSAGVVFAGALGAIGGTALQASWLLDDNPQTNWSLPMPHHFAPSGVYHAVFLILSTTVGSIAFYSVLFQTRLVSRTHPAWLAGHLRMGWAPFSVLASGWSFCGLIAADGGKGSSQVSTVGSVLVVAVGILFILAIVIGQIARFVIRTALYSMIASLAFVFASEADAPSIDTFFVVLAISISALGLASWARRAIRSVGVLSSIGSIVIAFALITPTLTNPTNLEINVSLSFAVWPLVAVGNSIVGSASVRNNLKRDYAWCVLASLPFANFLLTVDDRPVFAAIVIVISSILFGRLLFPAASVEFLEFQRLEARAGLGYNRQLSVAGRLIAIRLGALSIGGIASFAMLVFAGASSLGFVGGEGEPAMPSLKVVMLSGFLIAISCLTVYSIKGPRAFRSALQFGMVTTDCIASITLAVVLVQDVADSYSDYGGLGLQLVECSLVFAWTMDSVVNNSRMRGRPDGTALVWTVATSSSLLVSAIFFWASNFASQDASRQPISLVSSLAIFAVAVVANVWVAFLNGSILSYLPAADNSQRTAANYSLTSSLIQDSSVVSVLMLAVLWPCTVVLSHIGFSAPERMASAATIIIGLLLFFSGPLKWALRNNASQAKRYQVLSEREKAIQSASVLFPCRPSQFVNCVKLAAAIKTSPQPGLAQFSQILDLHVLIQNLIGLVSFGATGVGLVALTNESEFLGELEGKRLGDPSISRDQ